MDHLFRLACYFLEGNPQYRSHFYRNRKALEIKCGKLPLHDSVALDVLEPYVFTAASIAPLDPLDAGTTDEKRTIELLNNHFPNDPKFYSSLHKQLLLWKEFKNVSLEDFLKSKSGQNWLEQRKRLKRKPVYELDIPYKRTKESAIQNTLLGRQILRDNPFLRLEDLKVLGLRSPQNLLEQFPQLDLHRDQKLNDLKASLKQDA